MEMHGNLKEVSGLFHMLFFSIPESREVLLSWERLCITRGQSQKSPEGEQCPPSGPPALVGAFQEGGKGRT